MTGGRPWVLAETAWSALRDRAVQVAVLPWGATEAHNLHLPYGTDTYQSVAVGVEAARRATERGADVVVLPAVPFGANEQQLDITGTVNLHPSTQAAVLADVIESLGVHAIPKLVILNGHGGNDFKQIIREAQRGTSVFLSAVDWYAIEPPEGLFDDPGDHAGELETSVMLHLHPELVLPLSKAGPGEARRWRLAALREGWAWAPREWIRVTEDTGVGDPSPATPDKGRIYFDHVAERLAEYLHQLAATDPDALYE